MTLVRFGIAALVAGSLCGCATITRGTKDAWSVSSEPSGARVETSNGFFCAATPCAIKIPRKAEFVATLTHAGYKPATITVTHKISGQGGAGMAGNVILGGLIGVAVDGTSGAMMDLVPNPVFVKLEAEAVQAALPTPAPAPAAPVASAAAPPPAPTAAATIQPQVLAAATTTVVAPAVAATKPAQAALDQHNCGGMRVVGDPDALKCR